MTTTTDDWVRRSAAARLLEVAIQMLLNPAKQGPDDPNDRYQPPKFRNDLLVVEAAHHAIQQARDLLLEKES